MRRRRRKKSWRRKDAEGERMNKNSDENIQRKLIRSNKRKVRKRRRILKKRIANETEKNTNLNCDDVEEFWWTDKGRRIRSRRRRIKENSKGEGRSRTWKVVTMNVEKFWKEQLNFRGWMIKKKRTEGEGNSEQG